MKTLSRAFTIAFRIGGHLACRVRPENLGLTDPRMDMMQMMMEQMMQRGQMAESMPAR